MSKGWIVLIVLVLIALVVFGQYVGVRNTLVTKDQAVKAVSYTHLDVYKRQVWSVEVSSVGDLNFNGEFPLTSGGVYVGNETYPNFAADLATLKQGSVQLSLIHI